MVVNARVVLIVDASGGIGTDEVVYQGICVGTFRGRVGHRKEFERALVKTIRADYVLHSIALNYWIAWQAMVVDVTVLTKRSSCGRNRSKIATQLGRRGNCARGLGSCADHLTLEAEEEKRLVLLYGAADCPSKLILNERRARKVVKIREIVVRIEYLVAQILVGCAVKCVGTRFGGDINHATRVVTILRGNIVSLDAELLHHILRWNVGVEIVCRAIGGNTVHVELALVSETATNGVISEADRVRPRPAGLVRDGVAVCVASRHHARYERQHILDVPPAQRYAFHLFPTDRCPERGTICLQWHLGSYFDALGDASHLQLRIHARRNTDLDLHSIFCEALETCRFNGDSVLPGAKIREGIVPIGIGL